MKSFKELIKIAEGYSQETRKHAVKIEEDLGELFVKMLGIDKTKANAIANVTKQEAEKQGANAAALDKVDANAVQAMAKPSADTTPAAPLSDIEQMKKDTALVFQDQMAQRKKEREAEQAALQKGPAPAAAADPDLQKGPAPAAGDEPDTDEPAAEPAADAGDDAGADTSDAGDAETQANRDAALKSFFSDRPANPAGANDGDAGDAEAQAAQAASKPDADAAQSPDAGDNDGSDTAAAQPAQQSTGLPAKLSQIKTTNLMKDFNAAGKQPMQQVKDIQTALSRLGFDPGKIDGLYGNNVFKAVQDFQKKNGLTVDGQIGPNTIKTLQAKLGGAAPAANQIGKPAATPAPTAQEPAANQIGKPAATPAPTAQEPAKAEPPKPAAPPAPAAQEPATQEPAAPEEFKFSPEQEKFLGGADRQDPNILARMPGEKPPVSYFKDPADQEIAKRANFGQQNLNTIKKLAGLKQGNPQTFAQPTQQNQSKDYGMKKAIKESASMNVSMTADTAAQVAELMKLLKNAGMPDAAPVSSIMTTKPAMPPIAPKQDNMADFIGMVDGGLQGPPEPCSVCGGMHEAMSCREDTSEYDAVVSEWDNTPNEEYRDANYMLNDLSGGLNRPKKAYPAAQDGDNAMAVEAIKSDLRKALALAEAKSKSKPDFLDIDGDGDKKEPMKKAVADKKKGAAPKKGVNPFAKKDTKVKEGVAGPDKCWPGHRKVGTKPGTGKNAGKRVNDCKKVKEGFDDMYKAAEKRKSEKGTGKFDSKKTSTGTVYTRKASTYDDGGKDSDQKKADKKDKK